MKAFLHPNRIPAPLSSAFLHDQDPTETWGARLRCNAARAMYSCLPPTESHGCTLATGLGLVEATNSFDLGGLLASFADGALVNDQLRDYWGKPASCAMDLV